MTLGATNLQSEKGDVVKEKRDEECARIVEPTPFWDGCG
jgi:hypothetical protein